MSNIHILLTLIFVTIPISQFVINPASIFEDPKLDDAMAVVDRFAAQSLALFAIVLVVIQFIISNPKMMNPANDVVGILVLSSGFLMITFVLEMFAGVRSLIFHTQITALRYSGLLLFTALYKMMESYTQSRLEIEILAIFVVMSWMIWGFHEAHYLSNRQYCKWKAREANRLDWLKKKLGEKWSEMDEWCEV